jgi:hypothetical protein
VGARDLSEAAGPVSVDTVFDRFPASVRGAVVVRGLDREPHQIRLVAAEVVPAHDLARGVHPVAAERATVDVAPHREVLIPFDVPFAGLEPGWYCVVAEVEVDGRARLRGPEDGGKRFVVPWPSAEVRRADLRPNLEIGGAVIDRIELKTDRTAVRWRPPADAPDARLRLRLGARRLPVVEATDDPRGGGRLTVAHPVPKRATQLDLEVTAGRRKAAAQLDLP